ncbi:MAG: hypothetical protein ABIJ09_18165 [Pseudomonadota bacterium]
MYKLGSLLSSYQPLLDLLDELGFATTEQLHALYFSTQARPCRNWNPHQHRRIEPRSSGSLRNTRFKLGTLQRRGVISRLYFRAVGATRSAWFRPVQSSNQFRGPAAPVQLTSSPSLVAAVQRAWQRAELRRFAHHHATLHCDQSVRARRYLREATGIELPEVGILPYDILYRRKSDGRRRGYIYLVDDPSQPEKVILSWVPRPTGDAARVGYLFRPADDGSVYDAGAERWSYSPRAGRILKALLGDPRSTPLRPSWFGTVGILKLVKASQPDDPFADTLPQTRLVPAAI